MDRMLLQLTSLKFADSELDSIGPQQRVCYFIGQARRSSQKMPFPTEMLRKAKALTNRQCHSKLANRHAEKVQDCKIFGAKMDRERQQLLTGHIRCVIGQVAQDKLTSSRCRLGRFYWKAPNGMVIIRMAGRKEGRLSRKQAINSLTPIATAISAAGKALRAKTWHPGWLAAGWSVDCSPATDRPAISGDAAPKDGWQLVRTDGYSLHNMLYRRCRVATSVNAQETATGQTLQLRFQ